MRSKAEILSFLAQNKQMFRVNFHIVKIGIFGSYAREEQKDDSDLDLLIEFEENTEDLYHIKQQLKDYFHEKLNLEIDICREKYIKPRFKNSILKEAIYAD
jgi:uncharacterized protein